MQLLKDFFQLFFPNLCVTCSRTLLNGEEIICAFCRHDLPIVGHKCLKNNKIAKVFYGRISIEEITSFLYFKKEGKVRELIHQLKYKGNQNIGTFLGNWFGKTLKEQNAFLEIDYIIPVPLHKKRLEERGYNQLTTFGKALSQTLNVEYLPSILARVSSAKTQTYKQRFERFSNKETSFLLLNKKILEGKHILLVDDVITTGATLEACCNELLKTSNLKISIVTMAFTE